MNTSLSQLIMASSHSDCLPEQSHPPRYADCVERTGLGNSFRKRALEGKIPTQQARTLNAVADSNSIRDNAILNSGPVYGDVVTRIPGAHPECTNQDTHNYRFINPASVVFYPPPEKNINIGRERNIARDNTGSQHSLSGSSSHRLALESELQASTSSNDSASRTVVQSSRTNASHSSIWVSGIDMEDLDQSECSSDGDGQSSDLPSTPNEYAARIGEMGIRALETYDTVCCMLPSYVRRRKDIIELSRWINTQKYLLQVYNPILHDRMRQISSRPELQVLRPGAYSNVVKTLTSLKKQLDLPESFTKRHAVRDGEVICSRLRLNSQPQKLTDSKFGKPTSTDYTKKLRMWYKRLEYKFGAYVDAAFPFISHPRPTDRADLAQILDKLSTESHVSSHLKRCLCLACPQQCHSCHTAYLRLEPQKSVASSALAAEKASKQGSETSFEAIWHMAFKSTVAKEPRLIWFRVVSTIALRTLSQSSPAVQLPRGNRIQETARISSQTEKDPQLADTIAAASKKRRASSSLPEPAPKLVKTTSRHAESQDLNSERWSGIEICPEYLTWNQNINSEHAIVKITDSNIGDHQMFYLPRSTYRKKTKNISLGEAIRHKLQRSQEPSGTLLWVARTARLVAEAVVRFDLRDDDGTLEDSIVFHEASPVELDAHTWPFIKIKLEKTNTPLSTGAAIDINDQQQWRWETRRHVLLNLGIVLVQLGTHRDDVNDLQIPPTGPEAKQGFIMSHVRRTQKGMSEKYASAVQSCASLFSTAEVAGEEEFLKRFLEMVIQPLKECEETLSVKSSFSN